jgi:hypothetical protein
MRVIFIKDVYLDDEFPIVIRAGQEGELLDDTTGRIKMYDNIVVPDDLLTEDFLTQGEVTGVQPDCYVPKRTDLD